MKQLPIILTFIILFVAKMALWSQEADYGSILPPSPEASSLAKFTDIPVSHYTGLPQISVPIYSIEIDGLQIPISLLYHARGIGVEEIASRVGIGWALDAGGAVVRQTRGKPDDSGFGYLQFDFYKDIFENESTRHTVYDSLLDDMTDLEPDRFSFNFLGYSGKFYFDHRSNNKIIFQEEFSDIDIQPIFQESYKKILGWIITTNDGFKFYFGQPKSHSESDRIARNQDESVNYKATINNYELFLGEIEGTYNCWQLIDIVSPIGKIVRFNYQKESSVFCRKTYDWMNDNHTPQDNYKLYTLFSKITSHQYQLSSIDFDGNTINFVPNPLERDDLNGGHSLNYIEIINELGSQIKKFQLYHSYSFNESKSTVFPTLEVFDSTAAYRLFLDSLTVESGGTLQSSYKFNYFNKNGLPNRFSTSQDFWGYYNGKENGYFLNHWNAEENADDKTVDELKAMTGLLNRITYPTGGFVEYKFEANKATPPHYWDSLQFNQVNPTESKSIGMMKHPNYWISSQTYETDTFRVGNAKGYFTVNFWWWTNMENYSCTAAIIDTKTGSTKQAISGSMDFIANIIPPGVYKLRVHVNAFDDVNDIENGFSINLNWKEELIEDSIYSGGNRIKEITLNDGNGGTIKRRYDYSYNGKSSGQIYALPCYSFAKTFSSTGLQISGIVKPGSPLTYNQGNHLGYRTVTEYSENNGSNGGKTQYFFTNIEDEGEFWKFPFTIPDDNESLRGKPLQVNQFSFEESSGTYSLIKRKDYHYTFPTMLPIILNSDSSLNDKMRLSIPLIAFTGSDNGCNEHNFFKTYYIRAGAIQLKSLNTYEYFGEPLDENIITTEETFSYDNVDNYQLVQSKKKTSDGKIVTTNTYYPDNYNGLDSLKDKNIIVPVKTEKIIENNIVSGKVTEYNENGQPIKVYHYENNELVPSSNHNPSVLIPENYVLRTKIAYNKHSKPVQVTTNENENTYYIWDNSNNYLLAKIEHCDSTDLMENSTLVNYLSSLNPYDVYRTLNDNIRSILGRDKFITTYTYDPLIGITSQIDPNGIATFYSYDMLGRLISIRDNDFNSVKQYNYHYRGYPDTDNLLVVTVIFDSQAGGNTTSARILRNSKITEPIEPQRIGYNFEGWFKEPECISQWNFSTDTATNNMTLYAKWSIISYNVNASVIGTGGTVTPAGTSVVSYGGSITYTFTPSVGYRIKNVKINGNSIGPLNNYTLSNVTSNKNVEVEFEANMLSVSQTRLWFVSLGGNATFTITSNVNWSISKDASWITVSSLSGSGNATITVSVNTAIVERSGIITITGGGITKNINVSQFGTELILND